jgi:flavorubredoxin
MTTCFTATPGVDAITTTADIPALGSIAINAFVLHGTEPILVDTGTVAGASEFMIALASVIDSAELRWIWLTHTDFDHIGSLAALLEANPRLRVITSFLGVGIMGLSSTPLPLDRVHLVKDSGNYVNFLSDTGEEANARIEPHTAPNTSDSLV